MMWSVVALICIVANVLLISILYSMKRYINDLQYNRAELIGRSNQSARYVRVLQQRIHTLEQQLELRKTPQEIIAERVTIELARNHQPKQKETRNAQLSYNWGVPNKHQCNPDPRPAKTTRARG